MSNPLHDLAIACLFEPGEDSTSAVPAQGVVLQMGFHPERLASKRAEIAAMLMALDPKFRESGGGGFSFLAMGDGLPYLAHHRDFDTLLCLGIASGFVRYCLPRNLWSVLPGGAPYLVVLNVTKNMSELVTSPKSVL